MDLERHGRLTPVYEIAALQAAGAPHLYLEFPDKDHELWIRRGAAQMETKTSDQKCMMDSR